LRGAREEWRHQRTLHSHQLDPATPVKRVRTDELDAFTDEDDLVLVIRNWTYTGRGHSNARPEYLASAAKVIGPLLRWSSKIG
jgi:hypothetical protein